MIFHFALILSIIFLYALLCTRKNNPKRELFFLRITFIILFVLVATREMTIGNDTSSYLNLFEKCATMKWQIFTAGDYYESGYLTFNVLLSYISSSPRFFMIVMSAIFNFAIYRFIKKNSQNYLLSVLMYICLLFFYSSMTMMRQFLAIVLAISSVDYAKNKKILPFLLLIILAATIHSSAWLALPIYAMANMHFTRKRAITITIIGIIATLSIGALYSNFTQLVGRTNYYESRVGSNNISNLLYTIIFFAAYIITRFTLSKKQKNLSKKESFYLYTLLSAAVISMVGINMNVMSRAIIYYSIFSIISIPNLLSGYVQASTTKKLLQFVFILFLVAYSSTIIVLRPEWNSAYRYKSCLIPKENYLCERS